MSHVPLELSMKTSISQAPVRSSNDVCPFCHYPLSLIGCAACSSWRGARPRNSAAALNPDPCFHPLEADLPLFPLLIVQICPPTSPWPPFHFQTALFGYDFFSFIWSSAICALSQFFLKSWFPFLKSRFWIVQLTSKDLEWDDMFEDPIEYVKSIYALLIRFRLGYWGWGR